ncbi:DUF4097 family beta strand repeat-containing protein [Kribbella sp. HUAS MG21]|uniref:DUF4097 family beta strand repeat-containing protein n=1 Tax=Kribbella sp. HUAS MG21 TaxID=3160966 RepID=A0AAU7TFQ9_9ACTN
MSDVQNSPGSSMTPQRRYGIAISVALILGGVYWALTGLTEGTTSGRNSYPVDGTSLRVQSGAATIELRPGDGTEVTVDRESKRNLFGSDPKESYDAGDATLELNHGGCGFLSFGCETKYVVTVPRNLALTVENSSGTVTVSGFDSGANIKTSSGDIEAHDLGGRVELRTSSGDVDAEDLSATSVTTQTSSGRTSLDFTTAPQSVESKSSSGDVEILIPSGEESYKVDTDTSSGDESANVRSDPAATRTITAKTSSGDVSIEYQR